MLVANSLASRMPVRCGTPYLSTRFAARGFTLVMRADLSGLSRIRIESHVLFAGVMSVSMTARFREDLGECPHVSKTYCADATLLLYAGNHDHKRAI